jgi:transcriptional regulator with XRE-family HTH domain
MNVGKKILKLRLQAKLSQREISVLSGLAVSYLSRLENDRITPSIKTLKKISQALGVPLTALLDREVASEAPAERCPVSPSGRCIMNQLFAGRGRKPKTQSETYSPQQLELLRLCNLLLQTDNKEIFTALSVIMKSFLALTEAQEQRPLRTVEAASTSLSPVPLTAAPRVAES